MQREKALRPGVDHVAVTIRRIGDAHDLEVVRSLFRAHQEGLVATEGEVAEGEVAEREVAEAHICFQDFEAELARLVDIYGEPAGTFILAEDETGAVGCVGVRAASPGVCELKRLHLRPGARGKGTGHRLAEAAVDAGRVLGYRKMVLDTLPSRGRAIALYRSLGFRPRETYPEGTTTRTLYFERDL